MTDEISDSMFVAIMVGFAGVLISITITVLTTMNLVKDDVVHNFTGAVVKDFRRDLAPVESGIVLSGSQIYKLLSDYEDNIYTIDILDTVEDAYGPQSTSWKFVNYRNNNWLSTIEWFLYSNQDVMYDVDISYVSNGIFVSAINCAYIRSNNNRYEQSSYSEGVLGVTEESLTDFHESILIDALLFYNRFIHKL